MMDLDLATFGIFLLSFALCAILVSVVSLLGAKEKSFEEAIEEQKQKQQQQQQKHAVKKKTKPTKAKKTNHEKIPNQTIAPVELPVADKSEKETAKKRKKGGKKPQPEVVTTTNLTKVEDASPIETAVKSSSGTNVLEIHRQYLQDDVADTLETPTSVTPEPPVKETLNLIKEAVPEETTPASTPEPPSASPNAGAKNNGVQNNKKKRMVIEEVEEKPILVELKENTLERKPSPMLGKNKKNKKHEKEINEVVVPEVTSKSKLSPRELITIVKGTALEDSESQQLIEILLNKQVGAGSVNGDWVDTGNKGQQNEIKNLQKQLAEKASALDEEVARTKSITGRVNLLRQELNQAKTLNVSSQRVLEEMQGRHQHEMAGIQGRLQHEVDQHQRDVSHLQGQLQYQIGQLQAQLLEAQSHAVDPAIYTELENLRSAKSALEAEIAGLRDQMSQQINGDNSSKDKLSSLEKQSEKTKRELSQVQEDKKSLEQKYQKLEDDKKKEISRLEKELSGVNENNKRVTANVKRLTDENERLSEQLAANVERPKVEGQEEESKVANGVEEGIQLKKKLEVLQREKDDLTEQNNKKIVSLQSEVKSYQQQVKQIQKDLDSQKQKNDDLSSEAGKSKSDTEQSQKALLERLFPDVPAPKKTSSHESWIEAFAAQIKAKQGQSSSNDKKLDKIKQEKAEETDKLEKQVAHYKMVLAQTENMLNELQSSVESEENEWKERVSQKDSELENLRQEKDELDKANSALQKSLTVVKQAEEMQEKLQELQAKLSEEESEKKDLIKKYSAAEKQLNENKSLKEEVENLRSRLSGEQSKNSTLGDKVAKLGQVVTTSQEALSQEQKTVDLLSEAKKSSDENGSPSNDHETPKTPQSVKSSQMGSVGSLDSNGSNTPKKVSKKKKILGLFK